MDADGQHSRERQARRERRHAVAEPADDRIAAGEPVELEVGGPDPFERRSGAP